MAAEIHGCSRETLRVIPMSGAAGSAVIVTKDGRNVLVDEDDLQWLTKVRWRSYKTKTKSREVRYAMAGNILMHRLIMGLERKDGKIVDHINGDGLDNRKANLRIATAQQNVGNMKKWRGKHRYKGVRYCNKSERWIASIVVDRKLIHLGVWMTEEQAARAYDEAAVEYRGEFANLNFSIDSESVSKA